MAPEPSQTVLGAQRIVLNQSGLDSLKFVELNKSSSVPGETRIPAVRHALSPMTILENPYGEQTAPIVYPNPKEPAQSEAAALPGVTADSPILDSKQQKVTAPLMTKNENSRHQQTTKTRAVEGRNHKITNHLH